MIGRKTQDRDNIMPMMLLSGVMSITRCCARTVVTLLQC